MPTETLAIRWKDPESAGYTDVFPISAFVRVGFLKELIHEVVGPKGGRDRACCSVTVRSTSADLDYKAFPEFDEKEEMYLGVLRLHFADQDRARIARAEWRPEGHKRFQPARVTVVEYAPPKLPPYRAPNGAGKRAMRAAKERPGQTAFRRLLKRIYDGRCCVTECEVAETLDGAHIGPYVSHLSDHPQNGLLLRKDLHCLFDAGQMAIEPGSRKVYFAKAAMTWPEYKCLHGTARLREPANGESDCRPSDAALQRRWNAFRAAHGVPR